MKKLFVLLISAVFLLASCEKQDETSLCDNSSSQAEVSNVSYEPTSEQTSSLPVEASEEDVRLFNKAFLRQMMPERIFDGSVFVFEPNAGKLTVQQNGAKEYSEDAVEFDSDFKPIGALLFVENGFVTGAEYDGNAFSYEYDDNGCIARISCRFNDGYLAVISLSNDGGITEITSDIPCDDRGDCSMKIYSFGGVPYCMTDAYPASSGAGDCIYRLVALDDEQYAMYASYFLCTYPCLLRSVFEQGGIDG